VQDGPDDFDWDAGGTTCLNCCSTEVYPEIEWTQEMIEDDMAILDDPRTIKAMERT